MRTFSAATLRKGLISCARAGTLEPFLSELSSEELRFLQYDWQIWARDDQLPPRSTEQGLPWMNWLILGGRGSGKTRAGAEWVRAQALGKMPFAASPSPRIALIGETLADVRSVMIEGVSGLLAVHPADERPKFEPSKRRLIWPNGSIAQIFSADDPESLRGPQFSASWSDEVAKWRYAQHCWDMLQFGLRIGDTPRQVVTTTPKPVPLLKLMLTDAGTVVSRAKTEANAPNLSPAFLRSVVARYQGTRLGRQELDAEILEDRPGSLWKRRQIDAARIDTAPQLQRIVVAVDPPVTSGKGADACGIVAAGLGCDGKGYVLQDATLEKASPMQWATAAASAFHNMQADALIAEVNQGGELVEAIIRQVDQYLPIIMVRAHRSKWLRAEPVAALYEQGRIVHVGAFPMLEDQMCDFGVDGLSQGSSPDRVDALVWALGELFHGVGRNPRIRPL